MKLVIVITGASSGFGKAAAEMLAAKGHTVYGLCRREMEHTTIKYRQCDVRDRGQIGAVVESPVGFHVIKVTREQEERMVPFDEVRQTLINGLKRRAQQKLIAEYIAGLREKSLIRFVGPLAPQDKPADAAPAEDAPAAPAESEG